MIPHLALVTVDVYHTFLRILVQLTKSPAGAEPSPDPRWPRRVMVIPDRDHRLPECCSRSPNLYRATKLVCFKLDSPDQTLPRLASLPPPPPNSA